MTAPTYLVVGGGNGLGEVTARALAREGANVVVSDPGTDVDGTGSDPEPARAVAREIRDEDGSAVAHFGDASEANDAAEAVETALESYGRLDGVANFAGILRD